MYRAIAYFLPILILVILDSKVLAQNVQELEKEIDSYELIRVNLSDSLSKIEARIDSLQDIIDKENYRKISEKGKQVNLKSGTQIYKGDHVTTEIIKKLPKGGTAIFIETTGTNYVKINSQGVIGYVPKWNIEDELETQIRIEENRIKALIDSVENNQKWIKTNVANLRKGPSTNYEIIEQFEKGRTVYAQLSKGKWIQVRYLESSYDRNKIKKREDIDKVYRSGWLHESLMSDNHVEPLTHFEKELLKDQQRRSRFVKNNPQLSESEKENILKGYISIGMTEEMVRASWGEPDDINRTIRASYTKEQWIFGSIPNRKYIYFENGILTTIQD